MNKKYLSVLTIIFLITIISMSLTACSYKQQTQTFIKHESKYSQLLKKQQETQSNTDNIIKLGESSTSYNYNFGPRDIPLPNFDVINVNMP